jgi:membrane fusion protein (multidrug efflux system)
MSTPSPEPEITRERWFPLDPGGVAAAVALAGGCAFWLALAPVTLYEVSGSARVRSQRRRVSARHTGCRRVIHSRLAIGRDVKEGEVLVEIETASEQLEVRNNSPGSRACAIRPRRCAFRSKPSSARVSRKRGPPDWVAKKTGAGSRGRSRRAARRGGDRPFASALDAGLIAQREYQQGVADAQGRRAGAQAKAIAVDRAGQDQLTRDRDRTARVRIWNRRSLRSSRRSPRSMQQSPCCTIASISAACARP